MKEHDTEIERLRAEVNCAVLLERFPPPWRLDRTQSSKACLKYRRSRDEVLIVNHGGRGWWDPQSDAKGDIFDLVQHLEPRLNFGEVRKVLRPFAGLSPSFLDAYDDRPRIRQTTPLVPIAQRWTRRPKLRRGSTVWSYLTRARALPASVLAAAGDADILREGPYGSAWFAHTDGAGAVTHIEIRGPEFKGSLRGGTKSLFRFPGGPPPHSRLLVAEAPIDALSRAVIEGIRADTLYAATGGGMGPGTIAAIEAILETLAATHEKLGVEVHCTSATDANSAGDRYAARHETLAIRAGVPFERLRPPIEGGDWNDRLKARRVDA